MNSYLIIVKHKPKGTDTFTVIAKDKSDAINKAKDMLNDKQDCYTSSIKIVKQIKKIKHKPYISSDLSLEYINIELDKI